ncbi:hypothetical protein CWB41_13455 [Methylovirgula ligni]|nr:hypothetical protein CWB41_13455 [Methylovirgula ligni]
MMRSILPEILPPRGLLVLSAPVDIDGFCQRRRQQSMATQGHIRADIRVHGNAHKAVVKSTGAIEARLHQWLVMLDWA